MTEIKIIFRFNISEIVFPPIEQVLKSENQINIISADRIRNEFLKSNDPIATKINQFIDKGEIIPSEFWCPFWSALLLKDQTNVFTSMIGSLEQFKKFETCISDQKFRISEIIYLKLNEVSRLTELAKQKYSKIYSNSDILKKHIQDYNSGRNEIIRYAENLYKVTISDFFTTEIKI